MQHFLEHLLVQRQVGHQHLQTPVLLLKLLQLLDLARREPAEPLLPAVERLLANAVLPAHLSDPVHFPLRIVLTPTR